MAISGLVALEAQLTSTAQRHLQAHFGPVQAVRGDGWVLFQFQPISAEKDDLSAQVQRLCVALVRDATNRASLRLTGEKEEMNFSSLADGTVSFTKLINQYGNVGELPADLDTISDVPAAATMLELLYADVASDLPGGAVAVSQFPAAMCPSGRRIDVLLQRTVCIKMFSSSTIDLVESNAGRRNSTIGTDNIEVSFMQNSMSALKLPSGPAAKVWIDTFSLAHALSSYSTASVENELPALWRSKAFSLQEAGEVLKIVHQSLVEYWNTNTHTERTKTNAISLLAIVSGDLREYIKGQIQLQGSGWRGPWRMSMSDVEAALQLCKQWNKIISRVPKQDWIDWDGGRFYDESFSDFAKCLNDVVRIRDVINNMVQLKENIPDTLLPETIFEGASMTDLRGTPMSTWERCVSVFEKELSFLEPKLRSHAKKLFTAQPSDNQVRLLLQFSSLLRREKIQDAVEKELAAVAEYMVKQLDSVKARYENNVRRATTDLQKLRAAKSCQAECVTIPETAYRLFGPNSTLTERVVEHAGHIIAMTRKNEGQVMGQWCGSISAQCAKMVQLEDAVVVSVNVSTHHLSCAVSQPLMQFLQDVRNIRGWCGGSASDHLKLSETVVNSIRACEHLVNAAHRTQQSVSNYNTVLQQMIPCTRGMLEPAIQRTLSQIIFADTTRRSISVANYQELEGLNLRFQNTVEALSSDNRHIRRFHYDFVSQVITLHSVDLTKHMDQWRSAVDGMRTSFEEFLAKHRFTNSDEWRRHWDCQIYKALEHQYCKGLESLHENMEEFSVELVFKQGVVQFKPTFEAIREAYYIKLREFVSVPLRFRGLQPKRDGGGTYEIYPVMPLMNNDRIITVHTKAIELFHKLNRVRKAFRSHIIIGLCGTNGAPDLDSIVEQWTETTERQAEGFLVVKEHLSRMTKIEDVMKVDCFAISTVPVKASMEEQLHRLEESLLNSMRRGIQQTLSDIDDFVFATSNVVERQPTTMDEVGKANVAYRDCLAQMPDYEAKFKLVEDLNAQLRHHSGASIEVGATRIRWEHLREAMSSHTKVIEASVAKMRVSLDGLIQKFLKDVQRFAANWSKHKALLLTAFKEKKPENVQKSLAFLKDQINDLDDLKAQGKELESKCDYFNQPKPKFSVLETTVEDVNSTSAMWGLYDTFQERLANLRAEDWLTFRSHTYQFDDFCKEWRTTLEKHGAAAGKGADNVIAGYLLDLLRAWEEVLPLLKFVRGDGWMTEHWNEMFRLVGIDRSITSATLTFGHILDSYQRVLQKQTELKQLHVRAQGEIQLREALQDLRTWALETKFKLVEPTDSTTKVKLITDWKDVMTLVSDNQALIASLKDSPFYANFADEASGWEVKLASLAESLLQLNSIQRKWTYLEPIFSRGALPQEQARFKRVDKDFVGILREIEADPRVMALTSQSDFNDKLKGILEQMERCQKSLMEYLDSKRDKLPRFYFISDEDLLEILGHSQSPSVIQSHLKKLFMGINSVVFNKEETAIIDMVSADHEHVKLIEPVPITDKDVEDWLIRLDACMRATLSELLTKCVAEPDPCDLECIRRYPSQVLQVAMQVHFTREVEAALANGSVASMVTVVEQQLKRLAGVPAGADNVTMLKIKALILDVIHNIEVAELLKERRVGSAEEWWWKKQLRYTMDSKNLCHVHMLDTTFDYTYEYQGNAAKLVHTPLTDKCYLVLTKGMGLGYGGNPYGPAGTGKTESVKALGSAMGRQVLVFNCDEGIDFKAMGRIFVGIVKCGAWGCFDEFNRLKIDQLSAISQMIQVIQEALKNREPTCPLLSKSVDVNPNAGIFVTLNPAGKGYGGRTKLPDNLKQLFREVAMSVPDNELITATMLLSEGFTHAKTLAKSVVELYKLCGQLMSHQQHYDWGLRPLKAVLRLGGTLVQRWKTEHPQQTATSAQEAELVVQSLNINTLSKLTFDDARLFGGLLRDIFPGVEARDITYDELEVAIRKAITELGLQPIKSQIHKVLQLYEAMNQRMGVVLVGPSGSGKSTLLAILRKALQVMSTEVPLHAMNSKAMPRHQLLGYMDPDTREWYDGVLTAAARDAVKQPKESRPWILCDGDIDPEWIESLNSVLDDNKLLTMPNGVRIQFGANVNFIFETHSLEYASPATVSRMGVLFFSDKDVHLEAVVESIMARQSEETRKLVMPLLMKYTFSAIDEAIRLDSLSVPTTRMGLLNACLNHVMGAVNEADFIYATIRGLGSALTPAGATKLAAWLYKESSQKPQSESRPLDTYWDAKVKRPAEFVADLKANITPAAFVAGNVPVIRTVEVQRLVATLAPLVKDSACKPFFLVGPEGCGKGALLEHCFASSNGLVTTSTIHCSAQTTATHVIQKLEQLCTLYSTNSGRVYRPREGERLVLILKNVNLPKPDKYGTVELHSFMQQMILFKGFYSRELEWIGVDRVQIVASMNPTPSAGRYPVAPRLLAVVNVVSMSYPTSQSMLHIYTTYWAGLLRSTQIGQGKDYQNGHELAQFVMGVFDRIRRRFEGEEYAHFHFCPRHVTNWIANVLLYKIDAQTTLPAVLAYEAQRIFSDCLPRPEDRARAEKIFAEQLASIGYSAPGRSERFATMFVTWFSDASSVDTNGVKQLQQKKLEDVSTEVEGALLRYSREFKDLGMTAIPEVVSWVTRLDRVFSRPGGHVIVVGRPGVGRRDAVILAAYMQRMEIVAPNMTHDYSVKDFRNDLRSYIQRATVQNCPMVLILEDHNVVNESFLEFANGIVSSGDIPGLFTPEEMESMLAPLREDAARDGHMGPMNSYFSARLQRNLRIALVMDNQHELFLVRLQSNPGLLSKCELLWMGTWSSEMAKTMCKAKLKDCMAALEADPGNKGFHLHREMVAVHESLEGKSTPKDMQVFMDTYQRILDSKSRFSSEKIERLEVGLTKLREAEEGVEAIQRDVATRKGEVEKMQKEADNALDEIQKNMQDSQEQRDQATELQEQLKEEHDDIVVKRSKVEDELSSIKPMMEAARDAVSTIRSEQLNEIRSLKAPPEPIRDVLEGVLALLGVSDVSWQSMRKFLGERGSKERILDFDVNDVTPQIRASVSKLLQQKASSFKQEVIHRASVAAAPMAEWVKAMVGYSTIMERIAPLTRQLEQLEANQKEGEEKLEYLKKKLRKIDKHVEELREQFAASCKEAERLRAKLEKSEEELQKAQDLLEKLSGEKTRWAGDAATIREANHSMPRRAVVSAAFITYLCQETEDVRLRYVKQWSDRLGFREEPVEFSAFMRSEGELLQFKAEGLPGDELSLENAVAMLDTTQTPLVVDPANQAIEWTKEHLRRKNVVVEVTSLHDGRFTHTLELAIRFGKTLLVTEVSAILPMLYPVLRRDLISAGAKRVVQVGNKQVDWQDTFRIILFSRNTDMKLPPDAAALLTEVNFSVTSLGLESQLLGLTIQHEKPELEQQKMELLKKEEALKLELSKLELRLLDELAESQGNLLENTQLVSSLNEVKTQSSSIQTALGQSHHLQRELDEKREVYRPFASKGSMLFFIVADMEKLNRMYQFGLPDFIALFVSTLKEYSGSDNAEEKVRGLVCRFARRCFHSVTLGLFKRDRIAFGLHLLRGLNPESFPKDRFDALIGAVTDVKVDVDAHMPSWAPLASKSKFAALYSCESGPALITKCGFSTDQKKWEAWMLSDSPEKELEKGYSLMEALLIINAFRSDRMGALSMSAILRELKVQSLAPAVSLEDAIRKGAAGSPVLLITSSGADPSLEVQDIATLAVGRQRFTQIALGGGQTDEAMQQLRRCAVQGEWIFLKNLHLVLDWAAVLEKELCAMPEPHKDFRLIITTEQHDLFPSVLLRMATKITVEAPPGVKQNLLRTYSTWDAPFIEGLKESGSQLLFVLAWFHAMVQERRSFVPQGWGKAYEFSPADLKAASDVLTTIAKQKAIDWVTLKGVLSNCIYGGRLENARDEQVLRQLLDTFFTEEVVLTRKTPLYKELLVPQSSNHDHIVATVRDSLPDVDAPDVLLLPDNADRAVLENAAMAQIEDLRCLSQSGMGAHASSDGWRILLAPVLEQWKSSGLTVSGPPRSIVSKNTDPEPMNVFFVSEVNILSQLIRDLTTYHEELRTIAEGTLIPSAAARAEAMELVSGRMPARWLDRMDGPRESKLWLALLSRKYAATTGWMKEPMSASIVYDLSSLLRPSTFFNALRQHTARQSKAPLVGLRLVACVGSSTSVTEGLQVSVSVKAATIFLQGVVLGADGKLRPVAGNSPSSVPLTTNIMVGWMSAERAESKISGFATIPVYNNVERQTLLFPLSIPCSDPAEEVRLSLGGVACFLMAV